MTKMRRMWLAAVLVVSLGACVGADEPLPDSGPVPADTEEVALPQPGPSIEVTPRGQSGEAPGRGIGVAGDGDITIEVQPDEANAPAPVVNRISQINVPFGDGIGNPVRVLISAVTEIIYEGACDVEVFEFDFGDVASPENATRSAIIPHAFNFELDDIDHAAFLMYEAKNPAGLEGVSFTPFDPLQFELRYAAREVCDGVPGAIGPSAVTEIRFAPATNATERSRRPENGTMG